VRFLRFAISMSKPASCSSAMSRRTVRLHRLRWILRPPSGRV
jgi:hypothetical protein